MKHLVPAQDSKTCFNIYGPSQHNFGAGKLKRLSIETNFLECNSVLNCNQVIVVNSKFMNTPVQPKGKTFVFSDVDNRQAVKNMLLHHLQIIFIKYFLFIPRGIPRFQRSPVLPCSIFDSVNSYYRM